MHAGFAALRAGMPMNVRREAPGRGRSPEVDEDVARLTALWRELRDRHGRGGDFLFGDFTLADAFHAPVVTRFRTYGVALDPTCAAYAEAVMAWPDVARWCQDARAETWTMPQYDEV
jgi:glutathione S-transferase